MTPEEKIIAAVQAFQSGIPLKQVLQQYKCSKSWLYKWVKRNKLDPTGLWYKEQSRRPKTVHSKISDQEKQKIVEIRKQLSSNPYSQTGAVSIQYEMLKQGLENMPAWKINRILNKEHLTTKPERVIKRSNEYPVINGLVDQMDFVGPRFIKGGCRYYSLNIIDTSTHHVHVNPIPSRETNHVMEALVRYWKQHGIPDFLQMDNELSFRGSNKYPHSFGSLIRLALHLKITVVFIPIKEPWRNGIIEKFNHTFDKRFVKAVHFENFDDLKMKAIEFEHFHNHNHRYGIHHNRTPQEQIKFEMPRELLNESFNTPPKPLQLNTGTIKLIRFIRSNLILDVFGEKYKLPKDLAYSYVEARIDVEDNMLYVLRDSKLVWMSAYLVKK